MKKLYSFFQSYFNILIGPLLFVCVLLLLPETMFSYSARGALGTVVWMATWWILRPVHIGITGLLPLIVNPIFGFVPVEDLLVNYADPVIILLIGADMIIVSWGLWGLDKRIALKSLGIIGTSVKQQIFVWFVLSVSLSMFLPNVVVTAVLTPIAVSMMSYIGLKREISESKVATAILLAIAWGAGLGGFGSPLGGAMNLIVIKYIEEMIIGREFMYITWVTRMLPMLIIVSGAILVYMLRFKFETTKLSGTKKFFEQEYRRLPSFNTGEKWGLILFIAAVLFSFGRPLLGEFLPSLKPAYIFLLCGVLTFILPGNNGERLSTWQYSSSKMMWGLYLLFAGGIAIGNFITLSGAGHAVAEILTDFNLDGGIITISVFVFLGILLSNISSNTAACAILTPIVINIIQLQGLNPIPYVYITLAASNCAFILPTSIRAIPVGYGLDPKIMFRKGLLALAISFVVVTILGYLFATYWPAFSTA